MFPDNKTYDPWLSILSLLCAFVLLLPQIFSVTADPDLWFHLRIGLDQVESGALSRVDKYSYGEVRELWISHEWLARLVFACAFKLFGFNGLLILRDLLIVLFVLTLWLALRNVSGAILSTFVFLLYFPYVSLFFNLRTQMFSFLFLMGEVLVFQHVADLKTSRLVWFLPLLFLLWANVHGGFVLGFTFCALSLFEKWRESSWSRAALRVAVIVLAACFLATFVNPFGWRLHAYILEEVRPSPIHSSLTEWKELAENQLPVYLVLVIPVLLAFVLSVFKARLSYVSLFLALGVSAISAIRNVGFLSIFSALTLADSLSAYIRSNTTLVVRAAAKFSPRFVLGTFLLVVCLLDFAAFSAPDHMSYGFDNNAKLFPVKAVEFIRSQKYMGKVALPFFWGGYVIWKLGPAVKVSADGRNISLYQPRYFLSQMLAWEEGNVDAFLRRGANLALVETNSKLDHGLKKKDGWREIYRDEQAAVFEIITERS